MTDVVVEHIRLNIRLFTDILLENILSGNLDLA